MTDVGMMPPSLGPIPDAAGGPLPPTVRHGGSGVAPPVNAAVSSPTDIGVAVTLASDPGFSALRAQQERSGSVPGARPLVDRAAETRASAGFGATQRLAQYGTAIDGLPPGASEPAGLPLLPDDAVRAALAQREPLEVPPTSGSHDARSQELVFPRTHGHTTGTGPLAAEARTRPPERGMLLPLFAAAAVGAALVGGAVLFVTKPWNKPASSTSHAGEAPPPPPTVATVVPAPSATSVTEKATAPTVAPVVAPTTASPVLGAPAARPATAHGQARPSVPPVPSVPSVLSAGPPASSAGRKPPRPPSATPRPEDVGFE
jgi:hypothetical protein